MYSFIYNGVPFGGYNYGIFGWLGTHETTTLMYCLSQKDVKITEGSKSPYCIEINTDKTEAEIIEVLNEIKAGNIDKSSLVPGDVFVGGKFNDYIPIELLNKQYQEDYVDVEGMREKLL